MASHSRMVGRMSDGEEREITVERSGTTVTVKRLDPSGQPYQLLTLTPENVIRLAGRLLVAVDDIAVEDSD